MEEPIVEVLLSWALLAATIWCTAALLPGFAIKRVRGAVLVAALFGLLNWAIGWLLFVAVGLATLGLGFLMAFVTRWFVTAILLKFTSGLSESLEIRGFGPALLGSLVMSLLGTLAEVVLKTVT